MIGLFQRFLYINAAASVLYHNASHNWLGILSGVCAGIVVLFAMLEACLECKKSPQTPRATEDK